MGFARAPQLDFSPAPGIVAKGYKLPLTLPSPPSGARVLADSLSPLGRGPG